MKLADYQRAMVRASFAEEPSSDDLAALGDDAKARMYRAMVRSRLLGMARTAFRGAEELLGPKPFEALFSRFLHERSARSPYLRDVIAAFGDFALERDVAEAPACFRDLLRFELAKWRAAYVHAPRLDGSHVREFDFEGVPVLNPVLTLLSLDHAIQQPERVATPTLLFMYRPAELDQVRWYASEPYFFALIARIRETREPFVVSVRETADAQGLVLDEALLERLSSGVTLALTRQVLLGSTLA